MVPGLGWDHFSTIFSPFFDHFLGTSFGEAQNHQKTIFSPCSLGGGGGPKTFFHHFPGFKAVEPRALIKLHPPRKLNPSFLFAPYPPNFIVEARKEHGRRIVPTLK